MESTIVSTRLALSRHTDTQTDSGDTKRSGSGSGNGRTKDEDLKETDSKKKGF